MIGIKKEKSDYQQPLKLKFKDICTAQKWMKAMMKLQEAQGWIGHMDTDKYKEADKNKMEKLVYFCYLSLTIIKW